MGFMRVIKDLGGFFSALSGLVNSLITLIRIVQRCSATIEFKAKLSADTKGMFSWATDILSTIFNDIIPLEHLSEKDSLILMGYSFYLSFPFFFISIYKSAGISFLTLNSAAAFTLIGFSINYLPGGFGWLLFFSYPLAVLGTALTGLLFYALGTCFQPFLIVTLLMLLLFNVLIGVIPSLCEIISVHDIQLNFDKWDIRLGTLISFLVFSITSLFTLGTKVIFLIITMVSYVVIFIGINIVFKFAPDKIEGWMVTIFTKLSSIFVIPIISCMTDLHSTNEGIPTSAIVYIIIVPLFSSFLFSSLLTYTRNPTVVINYNKGKHYFEIFDNLMKYVYAFASAYDPTLWSCVIIEVVTFIAIVYFKPYRYYSAYALNIGECLVVVTANLIAMFYDGQFPVSIVMTIISLGCLPIIVSIYIYFIFDFGKKPEIEPEENIGVINTVSVFIVLVGFLFYGYSVPFVYGLV